MRRGDEVLELLQSLVADFELLAGLEDVNALESSLSVSHKDGAKWKLYGGSERKAIGVSLGLEAVTRFSSDCLHGKGEVCREHADEMGGSLQAVGGQNVSFSEGIAPSDDRMEMGDESGFEHGKHLKVHRRIQGRDTLSEKCE